MSALKIYDFYESPLGTMKIECDGTAVTGLRWLRKADSTNPASTGLCWRGKADGANPSPTGLTRLVKSELDEYFAGVRKEFSFPYRLTGTDFQKKVWEALRTIPYGETRSYRDIAVMTGHPKACRAVGMANHNNPIVIAIPCHRVICSSGELGGYAEGVEMKAALLKLEREDRDASGKA